MIFPSKTKIKKREKREIAFVFNLAKPIFSSIVLGETCHKIFTAIDSFIQSFSQIDFALNCFVLIFGML
jgi:hypothetical protein